jgi:ribose transport system substrate-binding protein
MRKKILTNLILIILILVLVISLTTGLLYSNKIYQVSKELKRLEAAQVADYHVMVIVDGTDEAYTKSLYKGLNEACIANNVAAEFIIVKETDYVRSFLEKFDMAIQSNVDGIIIHAFKNPELEAYVKKATDKGIPVITMNEDLAMTDRISYIGVNKYQIGYKAGQKLMEAMPGPGKIAVIEKNVIYNDSVDEVLEEGKVSDNVIIMGMRDAIKEREDLSIEVVKYTDKGLLSAEGVTINLFEDYDGINGIFCADGQDTLGVIQVLLDFNKVSEVTLVGYDDDPEILDYIARSNVIEATIVTDYGIIGRKAIEAFVEYKKEAIVSSYINTEVTVVDKKNISQYQYMNEKGDANATE